MNIMQLGNSSFLIAASSNSDRYSKALLNTLLGMGTVFVILVFISVLISLLKYVPILVKIFTNQNRPKSVSTDKDQMNAPTNVTSEVSEELVDDSELVAVITAAIMASLGDDTPTDGFIVRSIRKANRNGRRIYL
jgi:Na+-transporting methylmalonyl-CoA/oxaloacetate decarboxylase gamma subunit